MFEENNFKFVMPADLEKSEDGDWKVRGLASTEDTDRQGEIIMQKGIDLTPVKQGRGYFNYDHLPGPENLVGTIDNYQHTPSGLFVEGKLFKNHSRAKAIYEVMSSLGKSDRGRVGLSVEGRILERDPKNPRVIRKCEISKVAITLNPVNANTYADIMKSMDANAVDFNAIEDNYKSDDTQTTQIATQAEPTFTASQVVAMIKALGIGDGYTKAPNTLTHGDSLATSDMKLDDNKKKKLKKMDKCMYKSMMVDLLDKLQVLHPDVPRTDLWEAVRERLETKFPEIK